MEETNRTNFMTAGGGFVLQNKYGASKATLVLKKPRSGQNNTYKKSSDDGGGGDEHRSRVEVARSVLLEK